MKKNVYSPVLSEDVVHEIDKLAYQRGTNRSNMVNQILAEYASLITPEKRMSHLLAEVRRHFESAAGFQLPEAASAGMMNLRTALRYKYNPTVRYSLELSRDNQSAPSGSRCGRRIPSSSWPWSIFTACGIPWKRFSWAGSKAWWMANAISGF